MRSSINPSALHRVPTYSYFLLCLPILLPKPFLIEPLFPSVHLCTIQGNTFGPEFEAMYQGHRNYFYYMNKNAVVPGAEAAAPIFEGSMRILAR